MKTLKSLLYALIAVFVLVGCTEEVEFTAGAPEDPNCYGVFFPTQTNAGDLELDPAEETKLQFTVRRTKSEGEIVVPVTVNASAKDIFTVTDIQFVDGAEESTFDVIFPNAEVGTSYSCEINIEDPKYAASYGDMATGFTFTVTRVKWNQVIGENGDDMGSWTDVLAGSPFGNPSATGKCKVYERDDTKGYYRFENPYNKQLVDGVFGNGAYERLAWPADVIVIATNPEQVYIPNQEIGLSVNKGAPTEYGSIRFASDVKVNFPTTDPELYGSLKDGVITFPKKSVWMSMALYSNAAFAFNNDAAEMVLLLPGAIVRDYSIKLSNTESKNGVVKVGVSLGADVTKAEYQIFKGALSEAQAETRSKEIAAGETPSEIITASATLDVAMEETGIYTIVANVYDAAGVKQGYSYLNFGYIKAGEEVPIVLTYGLDVTNEFAAKGFTKENSVKLYANGTGIQSAKYGLFDKSKVAANADLGALVEESGSDFSAEQLAKINGDGFSGMIGNLVGGTEYLLIIAANNGYVTKVFTATATTEGTPHPLKRTYTINDFLKVQLTKDQYIKDWSYYAVDKNSKTGNTSRIKVGTVTLSDNTTADTDGFDFMNIKGLTGVADLIGGDDTMLIEFYNGVLYSVEDQIIGSYENLPVSYWMTDTKFNGYSSAGYALLGGRVEDGYISLVGNPQFIENRDVTFTGIRFLSFTDNTLGTGKMGLTWFYNLMFVDPTIDKANPMTISSSMPTVSHEALDQIAKAAVVPNNYVELRDRMRMRALIDEYVKAPKSSVNVASSTTEVAMPSLGVAKAQVSVTPGVATPSVVGELKIKSNAQRIKK